MDNETFNMSLRKFLKQVGVTSQKAIEDHVRSAGKTTGDLDIKMILTVEGTEFTHEVTGKINLG